MVLGTAYLAYVDVKRCYEARESYAVGYITYQEMELAKNTVRQIEDAMRPKLDPGTTTDDVWSASMKREDQSFYPSRDFVDGDRRHCRERFNWLLQVLREAGAGKRQDRKGFLSGEEFRRRNGIALVGLPLSFLDPRLFFFR